MGLNRDDPALNIKITLKLQLPGFLVGLANSNGGDTCRIFSGESRPQCQFSETMKFQVHLTSFFFFFLSYILQCSATEKLDIFIELWGQLVFFVKFSKNLYHCRDQEICLNLVVTYVGKSFSENWSGGSINEKQK